MTTKQAEDINSKFTKMRDSILSFKNELNNNRNHYNESIKTFKDSIVKLNTDFRIKEGEANWYKNQYYDEINNNYKYLRGVRSNMNVLIGITALLTAFVTIRGK